jgi:hypothetical protein
MVVLVVMIPVLAGLFLIVMERLETGLLPVRVSVPTSAVRPGAGPESPDDELIDGGGAPPAEAETSMVLT